MFSTDALLLPNNFSPWLLESVHVEPLDVKGFLYFPITIALQTTSPIVGFLDQHIGKTHLGYSLKRWPPVGLLEPLWTLPLFQGILDSCSLA